MSGHLDVIGTDRHVNGFRDGQLGQLLHVVGVRMTLQNQTVGVYR